MMLRFWLPILAFLLPSAFLSSGRAQSFESAALISESAKIALGSSEQALIDSTYSRILLTPSGLSICLIMQGHAGVLRSLTGLSDKAAQSVAETCKAKAFKIWGADILKYQVLSPEKLGLMRQRPPKKIYVVSLPTDFPYDSWTDLDNNTFIAANSFNAEKLIFILSHELQIAFDSKSRMGSAFLGDIEDGWTVFSKKLFKPSVARDFTRTLDAIQNSSLRKIFSIMRAFTFERAVLKELSDDNTTFKVDFGTNDQCELMVDELIQNYKETEKPTARDIHELLTTWKLVQTSHLGLKYPARGIGEISICQFMSSPSFNSSNITTSGPRPRIRPTSKGQLETMKENMTSQEKAAYQNALERLNPIKGSSL